MEGRRRHRESGFDVQGWLIALGLVVVAAVVVGWLLAKHAFAGAGEELGRRTVEALAARGRTRSLHKAARRAARAGDDPPTVLVTLAGEPAAQALAELRGKLTPTPEAALLLGAIDDTESPFAGRPAVLVVVGPGAGDAIAAIARHTGRDVVPAMLAVEPRPCGDGAEGLSGFWDELEDNLRQADAAACATAGAFIAIVLRPPLTGTWEVERQVDAQALVARVLAAASCDVWMTVRDPAREGAWPSTVTVVFPTDASTMRRALSNAGTPLPASAAVAEDAVTLPGPVAAQLVASLAGIAGVSMLGDAAAPPYSPAVTLALSSPGGNSTGLVRRDGTETEAIQAFLRAAGVRILASPVEDVDLKLPLSTFPTRTVATRFAVRPSEQSPYEVGALRAGAGALERPMRWLNEAIESGDQDVAAAVLADHGRSWLELQDPGEGLSLIRRAHDQLARGSRPFLWSHYLLALDSALRLNEPSEHWFTDELCDLADETELGPLFHAERMEFRRLRGDLQSAVVDANLLIQRLGRLRANSSAERYVAGTARYVLANVLRRGGRYDLAKGMILDSTRIFTEAVAAHRIEMTHALYALNVCDSMFGVASVQASPTWSPNEAVFARSLVTLANCHASWFVEDYDRAAHFATSAEEGFANIGYERYARRAASLRGLIADWADRAGRRLACTRGPARDARVTALLDAPPGAAVHWLADERPSHVLSLLQFSEAFGDPESARTVELPELVGTEPDGDLVLYRPPRASSYGEAQAVMRAGMGVGQGSRVPLAAD